jgi:nitrate/TMAO reductase-like tetraheme cytochrome c subunit
MIRITVAIMLAVAACGGDDGGTTLTAEQLQDPSTCMSCHPKHYDQWSGSMHAYASEDPVFVAMNKRGQRETNGQLGTFCVQCHAPMAVALNTTNGTDYDPSTLTPATKGITCFFCHTVKDVQADHNNGLVIDAQSTTLYGGAKNPVSNKAHHAEYDERMDSDINDSAMCGSCHDVVTPKGVALERTFSEWKTTFFSSSTNPELHLSCGGCHMPSTAKDVIADDPDANVPERAHGFHEHLWPAIDQAMTAFPNVDVMAGRIQDEIDSTVTIIGLKPLVGDPQSGICVTPEGGGTIRVRMDTLSLAHAWPSGAAQDRRAWLEVNAYDASNNLLLSTGVVPDGMDPEDVVYTAPAVAPPAEALMWDRTWKDAGKTMPAHFFWDVVAEDPRYQLKPPITLDPNSPQFDHSSTALIPAIGMQHTIDHVTARIRIRPFAYGVIDELIASGDLDPAIRDKVPTIDILATQQTWNAQHADPVTGCDFPPGQ